MKKTNRFLTVLIFIFLYIPMFVLIVASFNTGKDITHFEGFTLARYAELFHDEHLLKLLGNSLLVSVLASLTATVFGTLSAMGINALNPRMRQAAMTLTNIPMTNPDIVTGVSLGLLFVFVGTKMLGQRDSLTFWTLLIAHITFSLPYVILNVMPKLKQMDRSLTDAAMDLGCTPFQAFYKVTLPEIMPGIVSGGIMAFTMSLDDFVISYFVSGLDFVTLPVEIYSYTKKPIQPKIYAMFTLLFGLIFVLMVAMNIMQLSGDKRKKEARNASDSKATRFVIRAVAAVLAIVLLFGIGYGIFSVRQETITLNVYNWGQYIADGSDGSMEVIAEFEKRYPHIKVNYSTYDSNEIMYSKLSNGGITVDLIIPSDYMIARMIQEDMRLPLNFDTIPNYRFIDEDFRNTDYDPENKYSVPYTWGTVGLLYNTKFVDEADVTGWELLWNDKYAGKILTFGNSRDAFGIAELMLGYSINTTDKEELQACAELLKKQKPVLQQYVMDEIFAIMQNEEAWSAPYYAGDCLTMMGENENLDFFLPGHQGFNMFIDAMCIPACAKEKDAAELFINFLCEPEIAGANMDWICYGTPLSAAKEYMDPETVSDPVTYPSEDALKNGSSFAYLPEEISRYMESLFMDVRNS